MIIIEVGNTFSYLIGEVSSAVLNGIDKELSYELPGAFFARKRNPWADGYKHLFSRTTKSFPTGLYRRVKKVLKSRGVEFRVIDKRPSVTLGESLPIHEIEFRDYQQKAIDESIKRQRGIVKIGTGGGKTNVIAGVVAKLNMSTLILIHKTDIYYQIIERLEKSLKVPIGRIGDSVCDIQPITVGMIQSIASALKTGRKVKRGKKFVWVLDPKETRERKKPTVEFVKNVNCIITDECHHTPADSFLDVHEKAENAFYKIGMSASPWRDDLNDMLIEAYQGDILIDTPASDLIDKGYLVPPLLQLLKFDHGIPVKTKIRYPQLYDDQVVGNVQRNRMICDAAVKASNAGKSVLIAVTKIEHGHILEEMLRDRFADAIFVFGEAESEIRKEILTDLNNKKRKIVICTTIFGEGVDVPNLDVLINAKAGASSVDSFQLVGRVLRKPIGKTKAYVVDIFDTHCKYLATHSRAREKIYKTEPRYQFNHITSVGELVFDDAKW